MKKIFVAIAICGYLFASCGNRSNNNNQGTHTHEDGSVHGDHDATPQAKPAQETFEVKADSITVKADSLKNQAHDRHEHDHGDGKPHKH